MLHIMTTCQGKYHNTRTEHEKMESFRFLQAVILLGALGNWHPLLVSTGGHGGHEVNTACFSACPNGVHAVACAGSVVLTQTHPAAPYVYRTDNIAIRCQYDGVENVVAVLWAIGTETTTNASTIPGHTALPRTSTYQEVVVDSCTNLRERYQCAPILVNGTSLDSNEYEPQIECK